MADFKGRLGKQATLARSSNTRGLQTEFMPFLEIVKCGIDAVPFIVNKLKEGEFVLNEAMRAITGMDMHERFPEADSEQEISRLWILWWETKQSISEPE